MRRPSAAARGASGAFSIISLFSRFLVYPDLCERVMCSGFALQPLALGQSWPDWNDVKVADYNDGSINQGINQHSVT